MKSKEGTNFPVKSVVLTIRCVGDRTIKIEETKIRYAIEDLTVISEKIKLVNINIAFSSGEHKRANCDSKDKAISWLNLNNMEE